MLAALGTGGSRITEQRLTGRLARENIGRRGRRLPGRGSLRDITLVGVIFMGLWLVARHGRAREIT
jgi:hypothetical protein